MYIHTNLNKELIQKYPLKRETVNFNTSDGETISAWYMPVKTPKAAVILVHGYTATNGGKALMLPHADYLSKNGYSCLLVDLRAAGESTGNKVFLGTKEWMDAQAAYDFLKTRKELKNKNIGLFGISMGAVTTINTIANTGKGDFLVASVPYASYKKQFTYELGKAHLWVPLFLPLLLLAAKIEFGFDFQKYDPEKLISKIKKPIFIIAGKNDKDVSYTDGQELYTKANEPKQFWLADTQHDVFDEMPGEFAKKVLEFLKRAVS
jgi:alpha-beta hydrolase superfamily lysophospholipase